MEEHLAVLIDFENIAAGTEKEGLGRFDVQALMDRLKDKGRILVARSYADWGRFARFKQELLSANITMYELTSHGMQDKNRADIAMVVDCLELAFTRNYVDTFVIVSGDSDFTPLVLKMRELNKKVIGVGTRGSTSRLIINACDEFIFYDTIVKKKVHADRRPPQRRLPKEQASAFTFLVDTILGIQREDPTPPLASVLKTAIVRRQPDFNEEDLGFTSFARYLEAARDAGVVTLTRDQKSGGYRVDTPADDAVVAPPPVAAVAAEEQDRPESSDDPYYPAGCEALVASLVAAELTPLAGPTRMAALEALVDAVKERDSKKRRVTIPFLVDDIKRRLRRTHPDLSAKAIKEILGGLLQASQLMHKDGTPIRSANAPFTLTKNAEQLNRKLVELYVAELKRAGADLSDISLLAELFFGDRDRRRDVETAIAWSVTTDDLLVTEEPAERPAREGRDGRGRGRRDDRPPREDRGPRVDTATRDDLFLVEEDAPARPARSDRSDRSDRPARGSSLDDLLLVDDGAGSPIDADLFLVEDDRPARPARSDRSDRSDRSERSERPSPRPSRPAPRSGPVDDIDLLLVAEEGSSLEAAPARAEAAAAAAPAASASPAAPGGDEAASDEGGKKRRRRRRGGRRGEGAKGGEESEGDEGGDDDALLSVADEEPLPVSIDDILAVDEPAVVAEPAPVEEPAPARKPRSRKPKADAEAAPAEAAPADAPADAAEKKPRRARKPKAEPAAE